MAKMKLTQTAVSRLRAPTKSGRQELIWDSDLRGFGILLSGKTTAMSYVVQRKLPDGSARRVTIGATNIMTVEEARTKALGVLNQFASGLDPKAEKRRLADRGRTLRAAMEAYIRENTKLSERSRRGYRGSIERYLEGWLDLPLRAISRDMVEARHRQIAAETAKPSRSGGGENTGHATADATMRALRAIYNSALDKDSTMPPCPVRLRKQWFSVAPRERFLSGDQLPLFYQAVNTLESRTARDYLLLTLFTGLRRNEAAALRWSEVDFSSRVIRLPATRTKAGRRLDLPMSDFVRGLLVARRAIGRESDWVFPANSRSGHIEEPRFALEQIAQQTGIQISMHDLRRSFITHAEESDISVMALKALVNHAIGGDVTENYARITVERLREPAQKVCDRLVKLCGIEYPEEEEKVVPLR